VRVFEDLRWDSVAVLYTGMFCFVSNRRVHATAEYNLAINVTGTERDVRNTAATKQDYYT